MTRSKIFSSNLSKIRRERGLTIRELALKTGISHRMITHYENHVSHPSLDKIELLADALNVSLVELLGIQIMNEHSFKNNELDDLLKANIKTVKQLKKILRLTPVERSLVYKLVDNLLQSPEKKNPA